MARPEAEIKTWRVEGVDGSEVVKATSAYGAKQIIKKLGKLKGPFRTYEVRSDKP